jgi:hypothetical protein
VKDFKRWSGKSRVSYTREAGDIVGMSFWVAERLEIAQADEPQERKRIGKASPEEGGVLAS